MKRLEEVSAAEANAREVAAALEVAARQVRGGELRVMVNPELRGAVVGMCCVTVYVIAWRDGNGFNVECWHRFLSDPYRALSAATLDEAVRLALAQFGDLI